MSAQSPIVDSPSAFIGFNDLVGLLHGIFVKHGTSPEVASILAHNCASAERDGAHSHGIFRIPGYLSTLASGWVNGKAVPVVTDVASGFVRVDAGNGFAQPALEAARALLVDKARSAGIARVERYYSDAMMFGAYQQVYDKALGVAGGGPA